MRGPTCCNNTRCCSSLAANLLFKSSLEALSASASNSPSLLDRKVCYFRSWGIGDPGLTIPWQSWVRSRESYFETMRKQQRKPPSESGVNSQGSVPRVFGVASGNKYLDLVKLLLDLLIFRCQKINKLLRVARVEVYGPTRRRPAGATRLGHTPLVGARRLDHRSSQNGCSTRAVNTSELSILSVRRSRS